MNREQNLFTRMVARYESGDRPDVMNAVRNFTKSKLCKFILYLRGHKKAEIQLDILNTIAND